MHIKRLTYIILFMLAAVAAQAKAAYDNDTTYQRLRADMNHAFNSGDSAQFYPALQRLEDYLLGRDDLHGYYTQRCNEIIFEMNRQHIFEAYKLARQLSSELREKKLESEMYMAYNMLGHINRYCGNKETAKQNFYQVISLMEKYGYYESMPPIYMNIVNVAINDDHDEAMRLLDRALEIAQKYAPERVFDIETRRTISYFNAGDIPSFLEGYKAYRQGVAEGKSSVHGRMAEVYHLASLGKTAEAICLAKDELGEDSYDAMTMIYERAGLWKEAYESQKMSAAANDSINNVVLSNSMMGIRDQLSMYDLERTSARNRIIGLSVGVVLLGLLVAALSYIAISRRRHMKELSTAYQRALESDRMKTAFIQNMSHEVRTPLNIISGFAQVIANPELSADMNERKEIADMVRKNTDIITNLIDEMLALSFGESTTEVKKDDQVVVNDLLADLLQENQPNLQPGVTLSYDSSLSADFTLRTNRDLLKRVINALIDNAIKYTEQGTITLKAHTSDTSPRTPGPPYPRTLVLAVEDTGCGVPAEKAEHIFERFVKLDKFKEGIGLGLSLCRMMVTHLGGTITLDTSYQQQGARFVVELPVE